MLFASLGGYRIEGAFKRGASCALFFEEGTQIDNTVESFVQNAEKAKTCGLGSTTNVVPLSQARGIRGLQYFPTQMVDGPMLAPNYTNLSSGSGNGMRFPAQVTPDWVFSTFLCAQGHPETVTTLDDVEVDSHLGYGLTTRQHVRVGTPNLLTGYRKMFLGNQSSDLRLSVGEGRSASTSSVLSTTYMYGIGWDVGWVRPTTASQYAYGLLSLGSFTFMAPSLSGMTLFQPRNYTYSYRTLTGYPRNDTYTISYQTSLQSMNGASKSLAYPYVSLTSGEDSPIDVQLDFGMFGVRTNLGKFLCRITRDEIVSQPSVYVPGTTGSLVLETKLPAVESVVVM